MKDSLTKYYVTGFRKTVNNNTENKVFSSDRPFSKEHLCCMFFDEGWQIATLKGGYEINVEDMALKEKQPSPSPTIEISLDDAKKIKELHDVFLIFLKESDPTRYHYIEACYNEKYIKGTVLSEAIFKAESKEPQPTEADPDVARLKTAVAGLQNDRSNIITVLNRVQDRVNDIEERLSPVTAKAQTQVPVNTPALSIQDQVNELRKEVRDVQTRLSEIASTVSRSNLSQHIRLGGVEPNNL